MISRNYYKVGSTSMLLPKFSTIQKLFGIMVAQGKDVHVNHSIADGIYQTVLIRDAPTP